MRAALIAHYLLCVIFSWSCQLRFFSFHWTWNENTLFFVIRNVRFYWIQRTTAKCLHLWAISTQIQLLSRGRPRIQSSYIAKLPSNEIGNRNDVNWCHVHYHKSNIHNVSLKPHILDKNLCWVFGLLSSTSWTRAYLCWSVILQMVYCLILSIDGSAISMVFFLCVCFYCSFY